jgi:hypothetical protein
MAVAGEEQGLYGSTFFAQQAKAAGMDVEGMFTNDIIGSSTSDKGRRDPFTVRLFSEGVPTAETPQQAALRQSIGGENDGPSRHRALRQGGRRELGHRHARAPGSPTCPRTTSSSASAPWTATATAARWRSRCRAPRHPRAR